MALPWLHPSPVLVLRSPIPSPSFGPAPAPVLISALTVTFHDKMRQSYCSDTIYPDGVGGRWAHMMNLLFPWLSEATRLVTIINIPISFHLMGISGACAVVLWNCSLRVVSDCGFCGHPTHVGGPYQRANIATLLAYSASACLHASGVKSMPQTARRTALLGQ